MTNLHPLPHAVLLTCAALAASGCGSTSPAPTATEAPSVGRPLGPAPAATDSNVPPVPDTAAEPSAKRTEGDAPIPDTPDGAAPPPIARVGSGAAWRGMANGAIRFDRNITCRQQGFDAQEQRYLVVCASSTVGPRAILKAWRQALRLLNDDPANYTVVPRAAPAPSSR